MIINTKIKPLIANLIRLNLGEYLLSKNFDLLTLELNIDEIWQRVLYRPPYDELWANFNHEPTIEDAEESFKLFITTIFDKSENLFFKIIFAILKDLSEWANKDKNEMENVIKNLETLGMPKELLSELRRLKIHKIKNSSKMDITKSSENSQSTIKIFISYSHADESYKEKLIKHFSGLKRQGIIHSWHDREIIPGSELHREIPKELLGSQIILPLVSSDFIASKYCYEFEFKEALDMHKKNLAKVIPIIVRECDWKDLPLGKLLALPKDGQPIRSWDNDDAAYLNIVEGIKKAIESMKQPLEYSGRVIKKKNEKSIINEDKKERLLWKLPRGFLLIEDICFSTNDSWSITLNYCRYSGEWEYGTHYHISYKEAWEGFKIEDQFRKIHIPVSDWEYAYDPFTFIMELRSEKEGYNIRKIIREKQKNFNQLVEFYEKNEPIYLPEIPEKYKKLYETGELRDLIEKIFIDPWKNHRSLKSLHQIIEVAQRQAYLFLYKHLEKDNPALISVKKIADEYNPNMSLQELDTWCDRYRFALKDAMEFV